MTELTSARQHQKTGRPSWSARWRVQSEGNVLLVVRREELRGDLPLMYQEAAAPPKPKRRTAGGGSMAVVFRGGLVNTAVTCRGCSQDLKCPS